MDERIEVSGAQHAASNDTALCETVLAPSMITITFSEELCQLQWEEVKFQGCCSHGICSAFVVFKRHTLNSVTGFRE